MIHLTSLAERIIGDLNQSNNAGFQYISSPHRFPISQDISRDSFTPVQSPLLGTETRPQPPLPLGLNLAPLRPSPARDPKIRDEGEADRSDQSSPSPETASPTSTLLISLSLLKPPYRIALSLPNEPEAIPKKKNLECKPRRISLLSPFFSILQKNPT